MRTMLLLLSLSFTFGCATLAQYGEQAVPAIFSPVSGVVLEKDHALIPYRYCVEGKCVDRIAELTRFELELGDGEVIMCLAMRQYIKHVDSSVNDWIWPVGASDSRCEAEMERLAKP